MVFSMYPAAWEAEMPTGEPEMDREMMLKFLNGKL